MELAELVDKRDEPWIEAPRTLRNRRKHSQHTQLCSRDDRTERSIRDLVSVARLEAGQLVPSYVRVGAKVQCMQLGVGVDAEAARNPASEPLPSLQRVCPRRHRNRQRREEILCFVSRVIDVDEIGRAE